MDVLLTSMSCPGLRSCLFSFQFDIHKSSGTIAMSHRPEQLPGSHQSSQLLQLGMGVSGRFVEIYSVGTFVDETPPPLLDTPNHNGFTKKRPRNAPLLCPFCTAAAI
jgi:hypothetical protein